MDIRQNEVAVDAFRHEALLYDGIDEFVDRTAAFIREGSTRRSPSTQS